jgi:O-antigen/teichoic acid export membrane protein
VITTISMDANDLVVGKVLGFEPVAMISRAQGLMNLFHRDVMGAIRNVALPAYAQAHRQGEEMASKFRHSLALVTVFAWPFYVLVSLYSLEALRLLFGPQWDAAAPLVPIFCLAGALGAINSLVPSLLTAVGRIELLTTAELVVQPLRLVLVLAAAVIWRSTEAVAFAFFLSSLTTAPFFLWIASRGVPGVLKGMGKALAPSFAVMLAVVTPAAMHAAVMGFHRHDPISLVWVIPTVAIGLTLGLVVAELVRHPVTLEPLYAQLRARLTARVRRARRDGEA